MVNQYVENLVAADVVEPCSGPWSSPILLVPKKDGSLRAVADLRKVNKCVLQDSYAMPDAQELLDQLAESDWFTSIDLSSTATCRGLERLHCIHDEDAWLAEMESAANGFQELISVLPTRYRSSVGWVTIHVLCSIH